MTAISRKPRILLLAMLAGIAPAGLFAAQTQYPPEADIRVTAASPEPFDMAGATAGPAVDGIITARRGSLVQVTAPDGTHTPIVISSDTRITARRGLLGLGRNRLTDTALVNGLPVRVETVQADSGLVARRIVLRNGDLRTAAMIHGGTNQRFAANEAATETLRGAVASIDQYNVRSTTSVTFDTGRATLSDQAKADLCAAATSAGEIPNALLLVVGYTDSRGSDEVNQALSERRAGSVVNHLQQACRWQPYRMLTPTGMAEADPAASNDTAEGMAQNRRVTVSILVSKAVDNL
ncbi:MAG TPA: OmpA family protein [Allosphingosinicella sp.]|nr:OmpA family protein [Allosphingosinicella sp.]